MSRIDEIRERLDKATPGVVRIDGSHKAHENPKSAYAWTFQGKLADAVLLVHAHDDIRWLLDALARRDQRCEDLAVQLDAIRAVYDQHVVDVVAGSPAEKILDILNDTKEN